MRAESELLHCSSETRAAGAASTRTAAALHMAMQQPVPMPPAS